MGMVKKCSNLCEAPCIFAGGNVEKWRGLKARGKKRHRGQGGSERKKADLWLAVRHKALNYTVQASQE